MTDAQPKIAPLLPPQWDEAARDVMAVLPHGRDHIVEGFRIGKPPVGMNLVCTQLRHPALAKAFLTFNAHFFYASKLPARVREILILRTAWLCRAESEYIPHVLLGKKAGLTDDDVERFRQGPSAAGMLPEDAELVRAVDEIKADAGIGAATWAALVARGYDAAQLLEIIFIVGCYQTLAVTLNSVNVQLEPGAVGLDPAIKARMLAS